MHSLSKQVATILDIFSLPLIAKSIKFSLLIVAGFTAMSSFSWAAKGDAWTANLYLENDLFDGSDNNYTSGLRLSLVSPNLSSYINDPVIPTGLQDFNREFDRILDLRKGDTRNIVVSIGHLMYTPEDNMATELIEDDRPYAAYLYTGVAYHARKTSRLDSVELNLGVIGPAARGEQVQNTVHDIRDIDKFYGWDNQLNNELILQLTWEQKRRLMEAPLAQGLGFDFIAHGGAALGNKDVFLNLGGEYRIGWKLPHDFGTSAIRPGGDNSAPGLGDERLNGSNKLFRGMHVFIATDVRLVAHDIFLDGNTFSSSHSVEKKPWVGELSTGLSMLVEQWKISYAQVYRTKEFRQQDGHHSYGSITLSYSW